MVKALYWRIRTHAWDLLKRPAAFMAIGLGYDFLSKKQTLAFLKPFLVASHPESTCRLPTITDAAEPAKVIFRETTIVTAPSYVWQYVTPDKPASLLACGLLVSGTKVLNTDYWPYDALRAVFRPGPRNLRVTHTLIAPLGHFFDGSIFVGYYDFIFLIAAKLCRLKDTMPEAVFREAVVAYPLVHTRYERELLGLLGFAADRIVDSRETEVRCTACYLGNHDNWTHQNLADILLLKKHLEPVLSTPLTKKQRVYISRTDRRRILNEAALIALLQTYGFIIIADKPRTLVEQYAIYHNASFIIGPHGASFTNVLWCEPGTHLFELFSARYAPPHFLYLAQVLGLPYSAYCQEQNPVIDYSAIGEDISVSIPDLKRCLDQLLGQD